MYTYNESECKVFYQTLVARANNMCLWMPPMAPGVMYEINHTKKSFILLEKGVGNSKFIKLANKHIKKYTGYNVIDRVSN
jgi:hypothetical protein